MPIIGQESNASSPMYQMQINFKGLHNFEALYKMIFDWLAAREFKHWKTGTDVIEDYYQEIILSPGGPRNNWIWWRTKKEENKMFNYYIDIDFQCLVLGTKEVVYKGEKVKMNDGEISIFIKGYLEVDPSKQWGDKKDHHSFLSQMYQLYRNKEFIAIEDDKEADLAEYTNGLFERCKQFLNLMTVSNLQKPFHPELGYPQI